VRTSWSGATTCLVTEVRVHGVGGSPGPRLLGYDDESATRVVATHDGVTIRERRNNCLGRVQGFDLGELNSSSRVHAAWVFLAPFTLLNAAGWSLPRPEQRAQIAPMRLAQGLVIILGWLLTLSAAAWIAEILIDIVGFQWLAARLVDGPAAGSGWDLGPWTVNFTLGSARVTALVVSSAMTMVLFIVGALLAGRTRRAIAEPRIDDHPFTRRSELTDRGVSLDALRGLHRRCSISASWRASSARRSCRAPMRSQREELEPTPI
jgi:hypothetical protein